MATDQQIAAQQQFAETMEGFDARTGGTLGVMVRDFDTGLELTWNHEHPFPTASTMKVPMLYALYRLAEAGEIGLATRVPLRKNDRVPGSGVLEHLDNGLEPTVRDLAELMIIVSDNFATDLLYAMIGRERLAETLAELGLDQTYLPHTIWQMLSHVGGVDAEDPDLTYDELRERLKGSRAPDAPSPYRTDEYDRSTPADMVRLMTLIEEGYGISEESRAAIIEILKHQNFKDRIPGRFPEDIDIETAHKTGSLRGVRNDVGIVYAPGIAYAIAIMARDLPDPVVAVPEIAAASRWVLDFLMDRAAS
ncbi:MAG: class A beta-lactamase-related serine hydrolase [Chloroflexota bacterium]|nr:class A beta-lactamase-related serine hydrolase [Chloroflexota bacterium]